MTDTNDCKHERQCFYDRMVFGFCLHDDAGKRLVPTSLDNPQPVRQSNP